jgi:hypothetical protein
MKRISASAAFAVALVAGPAASAALRVEAASEAETPVQSHRVVLGDSCRFGVVPRIVITRPPINGALLVQTEIVRIPDDDPSCPGKAVRAAVVYYKSVLGYHGTDSFSYEQVPDSGKSFDIDVDIK